MRQYALFAPRPQNRFRRHVGRVVLMALLLIMPAAWATETENHSIRVLPARGQVVVDGKSDDWDLSGGVFACGEVEHLRSQYAVWFHAMYDAENIYLLARWVDPTPMNNPETFGGHGFNGDCLQVRFILYPDTPEKTVTWWTLWRDAKGVSVADRAWPGPSSGVTDNKLENLPHAEEHGVKQAFAVNADGKGYVQEVAIPWKLLSVSGKAPAVGARFKLTVEPNFTSGAFGRITIKDIFDENVSAPDRVFTFTAYKHWGWATLEGKGNVEPQPVRLADGRHFAVTMKDGVPVADWTGLIRRFEWPGFAPVAFEMPLAGYVSLNIIDRDGVVVRHLLNWDQRDAGRHTVQWDGLTDATFRTPGQPVPAGEYTWRAIAHPGAKVVFRGYASCGGKAPWIGSPDHFWLGDHGVPSAVIADADRMYLACNGAEGGHHLVATDFQGKWLWSLQNTSGGWDPEHIAVDGGAVYVLHPAGTKANSGSVVITRVDARSGGYTPWQGRKDHILMAGNIWAPDENGPTAFAGIAARDGLIYLSTPGAEGRLIVLDGASGKRVASWPLPGGGALHAISKSAVLAICNGSEIVAIDPATGKTSSRIKDLRNASGLTTDRDGNLYVSVGEPDMQVIVFSPQGKELRRIGRKGGHAPIGPWQADGMIHPAGVAVDKEGKLWVMEAYAHPKRVSVWNLKDGSLVRDFFGPTHYGASGAAINPRDPNLMVGEACEWRLDPKTGKSACLGAFDSEYHNYATYREGANGQLYLFTTTSTYGAGSMQVWQRLGDARYALRARLKNDVPKTGKGAGTTELWTDLNGDGKEQPDELQQREGALYYAGSNSWSLNIGPDLTIYALDWKDKKLKALSVEAFADSGAPKYDLAKLRPMPEAMSIGYERNMSCALPSADNKRILVNLAVKDHPAGFLWHGFDLASGKLLWTYPNPYFQVHGSHKAPAPEPGSSAARMGRSAR